MIDISKETLLTAKEAAALPAFRIRGKAPHPATIWRWMKFGSRTISGNKVSLECRRCPGGTFTSREACDRFIAALNDETAPAAAVASGADQAERELASAGLL